MTPLVSIGTDDGSWAPPMPVRLVVTTESRTGLGITNAESVRWRIEGQGVIVAAVILAGTGEWLRIDLAGGVRVVAGQDAVIAAGVLVIDCELPIVSGLRQLRGFGRLRPGSGAALTE